MCTHGLQVSVACVYGGGVSDREVISEVAQHNGLGHLKGHLGAHTPGCAPREREGERGREREREGEGGRGWVGMCS